MSEPGKNIDLDKSRNSSGLTLIELLVIVAILGVTIAVAGMSLRAFGNDLQNAASETSAFFKQARIKAISTTSAYRVVFESDTKLRAEHAVFCDKDETWEHDISLDLVLREDIVMDQSGFQAGEVLVCFNSRGITDDSYPENPEVILKDQNGLEKVVEVYKGGGVVIR